MIDRKNINLNSLKNYCASILPKIQSVDPAKLYESACLKIERLTNKLRILGNMSIEATRRQTLISKESLRKKISETSTIIGGKISIKFKREFLKNSTQNTPVLIRVTIDLRPPKAAS